MARTDGVIVYGESELAEVVECISCPIGDATGEVEKGGFGSEDEDDEGVGRSAGEVEEDVGSVIIGDNEVVG